MREIIDYIHDEISGRANITLNTTIYSLEAIQAAVYPFASRYHTLITPGTENSIVVIFEPKGDDVETVTDLKEFATSLTDHQVRWQLNRDNGKIRDLIVAHAFSPLDLQKEIDAK